MEQFLNHELEYVVDDYYDVTDFSEDDDDDVSPSIDDDDDDSMDSDFEDDLGLSNTKTDTSALEARNGKDIQGIAYVTKVLSGFVAKFFYFSSQECKEVEKCYNFFDFRFNTRLVKSTIVHFQVGSNVILFCSEIPKEIVAEGVLLISMDQNEKIDEIGLGHEFIKVVIRKAIQPAYFLIRPRRGVSTVREAVGKSVAWEYVNVMEK